MPQFSCSKLLPVLTITFLGLSSPLVFASNAQQLECENFLYQSTIDNLKNSNDLQQQLKKIDKWRNKLAKPLEPLTSLENDALCFLIGVLNNTEINIYLRRNSAEGLGYRAVYDQKIINALGKALGDDDSFLKKTVDSALREIIYGLVLKYKDEYDWKKIKEAEDNLKKIDGLVRNDDESLKDLKKYISQTLRHFEFKRSLLMFLYKISQDNIIVKFINENPWILLLLAYPLLMLGFYWIKPLWLLKIDERLLTSISEAMSGVQNPVASALTKIVLRGGRILLPLKYHPRVLDAWVSANLKSIKPYFLEKPTVKARKIYISNPVNINGNSVLAFTSKDLREQFRENSYILIRGEGGTGKTSLACQIAKWSMSDDENERLCRHRMLPVLIEEELVDGDSPFITAILGQWRTPLTGKLPSQELLEQLLKHKRILVIVDRFSEMSEETRQLLQPEKPDFPVYALVVTSRKANELARINKIAITPLRIHGSQVSFFLENYLKENGKLELFKDEKFFDALRQFSRIVGQTSSTVLLVTMFADQLIYEQLKLAHKFTLQNLNLADNIPDLMLNYLNRLNEEVEKADRLDNHIVHDDAKLVAWECLKQNYSPTPTEYESLLEVLATVYGQEGSKHHFQYLDEYLNLVQMMGPGEKIRFSIEPLAEYLAALHLLDLYSEDEKQWHEFVKKINAIPKDFLIVLRDCCYAKCTEKKVPIDVLKELSKVNGNSSNLPEFLSNEVLPIDESE